MATIRQGLGIILVLSIFSWASAQDATMDVPITVGKRGEAIAKFVSDLHDRFDFSGVVLAAREGEVVTAVSFGSTNGKATAPIETTTLLEIASTTKPFTAIAVLRLQEDGKLDLDDSISKLLPEVPEDCREITIRHLLQHTSGIPNTNSRGRGDKFAVVVPSFFNGAPKYPPGTAPPKLLADIVGNYENAQRGAITIERSGEDAEVTYRGKNGYNFRGYLDHVGRDEVELAHGAARGLPMQLQYGDGEAVKAIKLMGANYERKH